VSIGSDAVEVAEEYLRTGKKTGSTSIEQISDVYGRQAVVVSIDPRRVYVADPSSVSWCELLAAPRCMELLAPCGTLPVCPPIIFHGLCT
jgi:imidazole glycerol phosphate synthase subunit HisF